MNSSSAHDIDFNNVSFVEKRENVVRNIVLKKKLMRAKWEDKTTVAEVDDGYVAITFDDLYMSRMLLRFKPDKLPTGDVRFKLVKFDDYRIFTIGYDGREFCLMFYADRYILDPYNEMLNNTKTVSEFVVLSGVPVQKADLTMIKNAGGGAQVKTHVQFQKATYLVRLDKETNLKYILCKRAKVFLKDIRGKYKRVDQ